MLTGVVLGFFLCYFPLSIGVCLICVAIGLTLGERRDWLTVSEGITLYAALLAGVVLGVVSPGGDLAAPSNALGEREAIPVRGRIVEPPRYAPNRAVLVLEVSQAGTGDSDLGGRLRVTWREPDRTFLPGDEVAFTARLHPPSGTRNPGGFDYGAYLRRQGIAAVASVSGTGRIILLSSPSDPSRWTFWRTIERWRDRIRRAALASLADPARGIFLGIIIGEHGYLDDDIRDAFMATGTVHILSISGSHLGLVALLAFLLVKGSCRILPAAWLLALSRFVTPTRLAACTTLVLVTFYTLLAGAEVATVRSLVMIAIVMLAIWLGRGHDLLRAVAAAALLLVVANPSAVFDISFQLSFVAVAAIALVIGGQRSPADEGLPPRHVAVWERLGGWVRDYLRLTGGVTLATLPLVAYHFKQIAWLGLFVNAAVVPLAGAVLVPVGLVSAIWLLFSGQDVLPAAALNQVLSDFLSGMVGVFAMLPGAEWHVASPSVLAMGIFYVLLALALRPGAEEVTPWGRRSCLVGILLLAAWWAWSPRGSPDPDAVRVTFLDVGQGDASVIELPDGRTVLVDGGARYDTLDMGRAVVGPYLWERGITRLDHVIATHPQLDHIGGLAWVLREFEVGRYWSNGVVREEPFYWRVHDALRARGLGEDRAEEGRAIIENGPCRLDVLNPPPVGERMHSREAGATSGSLLNNLSVVTRLACGPHVFLLTADAEVETLARLYHRGALARATVLKVPHHGAASSLYRPWITDAGRITAVVSVGRHNPYGHPASEVVDVYRSAGIHVLRTDRDGAIWITARLSRPEVRVDTVRDAALRVVPLTERMAVEEWQNWRRLVH